MAVPIFPLGSVVFPTMIIPLQIFEPRYRVMMEYLMQGDGKFASVWIERGHEVGGRDDRTNVGTLIHVQEATELADGRWMMLGVGLQRVSVTKWLEEDPYPQGELEPWPDSFDGTAGASDPALLESLELAIGKWHSAVERGGQSIADLPELNPAPDIATHQLSALLPLASQDGHRLLCAPGPRERLVLLHEFLDGIELVMSMQES